MSLLALYCGLARAQFSCSVMKVLYIAATGYLVYMIRYKEPFKSK
jgi:hypothetical protein